MGAVQTWVRMCIAREPRMHLCVRSFACALGPLHVNLHIEVHVRARAYNVRKCNHTIEIEPVRSKPRSKSGKYFKFCHFRHLFVKFVHE